jgi:hypothetical protein
MLCRKFRPQILLNTGYYHRTFNYVRTVCLLGLVHWVLGQLVYFGGGGLWQTIPQLPVGSGCVCCECDKVQQPSRCLSCLSTRRLSSCDARSTLLVNLFLWQPCLVVHQGLSSTTQQDGQGKTYTEEFATTLFITVKIIQFSFNMLA